MSAWFILLLYKVCVLKLQRSSLVNTKRLTCNVIYTKMYLVDTKLWAKNVPQITDFTDFRLNERELKSFNARGINFTLF